MIKWSKNGLKVQAEQNARVRVYLVRRHREIKRNAAKLVGANLGFRQHAGLVCPAQQQALRDGEDSRLVHALIANGAHPDYQNG